MRLPSTVLLSWFVCVTAGCVADDEAQPEPDLASDTAELAGGTTTTGYAGVGRTSVPGVGSCTATWVAPKLVLTAAHCVCSGGICSNTGTVTFDNVPQSDDPNTPANEALTTTTAVATIAQSIVHPEFGIVPDSLTNDLALLRVSTVSPSTALVPGLAQRSTLPAVGQWSTMIGYGVVDSGGYCNAGAFGTKRVASTALDNIANKGAGGQDLGFGDPTVHICPGDSGGPVLDTSNQIMGVASWGSSGAWSEYESVWPSREWIGLQLLAPGGRVTAWDLSAAAGYGVTRAYEDTTPDLGGLLGWIDTDDIKLAGDFKQLGYDQVLYINRGGSGGHIRIVDYKDGQSPGESRLWENYGSALSNVLAEFDDVGDVQLVGDFLNLGYDQLFLLNRYASGGRVKILDFRGAAPLIRYSESYGQSVLLNGWHDSIDRVAAGDFRGLGWDQVVFFNNSGSGGRVLVADFRDGAVPAEVDHWINWGSGWDSFMNGWLDAGDIIIPGDFTGYGHDQIAFINQSGAGGRVQVLDFGHFSGAPVFRSFLELYGASTVMDGYHHGSDYQFAGDFRGTGHDQLLLVDRNGTGGALVVDFFDQASPAERVFEQRANEASGYAGRLDSDDGVIAGDFRDLGGRSILLALERW